MNYERQIKPNVKQDTASEPFVGKGMWCTSITDPDGYMIEFESLTDVPEETELSECKANEDKYNY